MDLIKQKQLFFVVLLASTFEIVQSGFNAVYLKKTTANYTCGSPPEEFFETQQGFINAEHRVPLICNASDPARAYPPENIVDGLLGTHWQSKADEDLAFIVINFEQAFFAQVINITFGNYRRPGAIMVEKSTDFGVTFTPWHYLVTEPASRKCSSNFGVQAFLGVIERVDQVLCMEYRRYVPPEYNETIFIELNQQGRGDGTPDPYTPGLQSWMNATAVRFRFSGLYRKFDMMAIKWHHYTVREIAVNARCDCKGHADGNHCPFNQSTGLRACQCQGNTCGGQCDQCCPLYNQFPWKPGNGAPWTNDPAAKCEPCNCHDHADTCIYNKTVSDLGLSMSINGSLIGGGVCVNCQHDTEGVNCEKCKNYFYRPLGRNHSDAGACQACLCNLNGTANASIISFGDCVRDEDVLSFHPGKQPGDCYCKTFVQGRQCDACIAGYYRLTRENPQGCTACNCHLNGTIGRSSVCQDDYHGLCNCKRNVALRDCSQCKDGYYNLQDSNVNGCKFCNCDVGGTKSGQKCDKVTGVCHCQPHVTGRTCNRTESGSYYPDLHFIHAAKSPYKPGTYALHVVLDIPQTGNFSLLIKYILSEGQGPVQIRVIIQYKNVTASGPQPGEFFNFSLSLRECSDVCPTKVKTDPPKDYFLLKNGLWMINITSAQPIQGLQLDRVVAIPEELAEATVLGADSNRFGFLCSIEANDMSSPSCLPWLFSMTMHYLQGALPCDCHPLGSNSSICESYGGQCSCKLGVEGRDCGRCKPGFYNLTASGCTSCKCNGPNKICDVTTGLCECPENKIGRTCLPCPCNNNTNRCLRTGECLGCQFNTTGFSCQHCADGYFGDAFNQQCNACSCNQVGSLHQSCNRVSGQCNCKSNVTGRDCSVCQNNTFDFGPNGCRYCECNPFGSASLQCSASGQCSCRDNVTGFKCTQCTLGFYGLPRMSCKECNCSTAGAINGSVCTNDTIGQCQCKPGVTERSCDQCMKYFTNFSDTGCAECSPCVQMLRHTIVDTTNHTNVTKTKFQALETFSHFDAPVVETDGLLKQAKVERQQFNARIGEGNQVYQELVTANIPQTNNSLKELSVKAQNLSSFSKAAAVNSTSILENVIDGKNKTLTVRQYLTSVDVVIGDVRTALNEHNAAAIQLLIESNTALQTTRGSNFTEHLSNVSKITQMTQNLSANIEDKLKRVYSQLFVARELEFPLKTKETNFTKIQELYNHTYVQFMEAIEQVYNYSQEIQATLEETKRLSEEELLALNRTRFSLLEANSTLSNTKSLVVDGAAVLEKYRHTVLPVSGELEVSMLRYELGPRQFVLRVLRGRNLPSRDFPSQTSDPYVVVSIIPDWNNEGTKRISTVSASVNPVFDFHLLRFTISMEQLNSTKVRLEVYDQDADDEDDLLGVAFIDLSKAGDFINNITEWYSLLPQDLSQINSGVFVASSGLTDVSNLLEAELGKIKQHLGNAAVKLQQAQNHASYLEALAQQMEQTFNRNRFHGTPALSAIDSYFEIEAMVNRSMDLVQQAHVTFNNITEKLGEVSLAGLKLNTDTVWQRFHELYNVTLQRNSSAYSLENNVYEANTTFLNTLAVWNKVYEKFPDIKNASTTYQTAARKAPEVEVYLYDAQNVVTNTSTFLSGLEAHLNEVEHSIVLLLERSAFIGNISKEGVTLMNKSFANVQNITTRLTPEPEEPPVNATMRQAKAIMKILPSFRHQIELEIDNTSNKLNRISELVALIPLALHLVNDTSIVVAPSRRTIENPLKNEISFDIKTDNSEGTLLYIEGFQHSSITELSGEEVHSLNILLSNRTVQVVFNLGNGPITAHNPLELKNGTWYNIYFTRFGAEAFLTVSGSTDARETVFVNGSSAGGNNMLQLTNQSSIYLGGLPDNLTESSGSGHFSGIIDNLVIDNTRYNLWNPKRVNGDGRLYAPLRYKTLFYPADGKAASFYGDGYIQHVPGQFNSSLGFAAVELDFRTLQQNGIIMAISNKQQRYHFVIYLHNGHVNFYFQPDQNNGITLQSTSSSYANGRWYRVRVVRTSVNATLSVRPAGSLETPDSRFSYTGMTVMDSDLVITFGALNPNSASSFEVTDAFSGDMNNLLLFSTRSGTLVPRYFNDPVLVIGNEGVSFSGVIKGPIEYGTRFYGYQEMAGECSYASVDVGNEQGPLSSLTFTFKTKEESGVLLYSRNEGSPSLYLALRHGYLVLWLGNTKLSPVFTSANNTFADNSWHMVRITLSGNGYLLHVNNTFFHSGTYDFIGSPLVFRTPFYMGGVPSNISSDVPYALCFRGGMKDLLINSRSISFLSGHTLGVSNAGVIPARVLPPIPKTCRAPLNPPTPSNNARTVHFGLLESKLESYIGFNLTNERSAIFKESFVVGLDFRAISNDGILLYATDNETHPTQFFSLELVHGRLVYKFDSGKGVVSISTTNKYSGKGNWHRVYILRHFHFGAILVSTREYSNGMHNPPSNTMSLQKLYIGGVPNDVVAPHLTNRYLGFVGCITEFREESDKFMFDLTELDMIGPEKSSGSCYRVAQPGLGFNGSSWARFDNFTLATNFSIQLTFRTSSRDGLLFLLIGNSTESGNKMYVSLEQSSGQINFIYNTTTNQSRVAWTEPGLAINSNSSFLMCQMEWHTVRVTKKGLNVTISLDNYDAVSGPVTGTRAAGDLFLGGFPADPLMRHYEGFKGCLKSFTSDGNSLQFASAAQLSQVTLACPLSNKEKDSVVNSE